MLKIAGEKIHTICIMCRIIARSHRIISPDFRSHANLLKQTEESVRYLLFAVCLRWLPIVFCSRVRWFRKSCDGASFQTLRLSRARDHAVKCHYYVTLIWPVTNQEPRQRQWAIVSRTIDSIVFQIEDGRHKFQPIRKWMKNSRWR